MATQIQTLGLSVLLICTCTCLVDGFLFHDSGEMYPVDPFLAVNETLNLTCTVTGYVPEKPLNASSMYFTFKPLESAYHERVPGEYHRVLDADSVRLVLPDMQLDQSGEYYCYMNESSITPGAKMLLQQTQVMVMAPLEPISSLHCVSDNGYNLTCDWCDEAQPSVYYELNWSISTILNGTCQNYKFNEHNVRCGCVFCFASTPTCEQDYFTMDYVMTVSGLYKMAPQIPEVLTGHQVEASFINIVKPRPPRAVTVTPLSTEVTVTWSVPRDLGPPSVFPLSYNLRYQSHWDTQPQVLTYLPANETQTEYTVTLTGLHPHTQYEGSITARPWPNGTYTSDPHTLSWLTEPDVPARAPYLAPGSFRDDGTNMLGLRSVIIFWQAIPPEFTHGEIDHYRLGIRQSDGTRTLNYTVTSGYYHNLGLRPGRDYEVTIAANTEGTQGYGPTASMVIPGQVLPPPAYIDAVVSSDQTAVLFTIQPPEGSSTAANMSYMLLHCRGSNLQKTCEDAPLSLWLPGNTTQYTFSGHESSFVYGLAVNTEGGSSGLTPAWVCLLDEDGDPGPVTFEFPASQSERSLTVEWAHLGCDISVRGKVEMYDIHVTAANSADNGTRYSVAVVPGRPRYFITVRDLRPDTEYTVTMAACTGVRCFTAVTKSRRTEESVADGPPQNVTIIAVVSDSVALRWSPPAVINGQPLRYRVSLTSLRHKPPVVYVPGTNLSSVVTGLHGYENYTVTVTMENSAGWSPVSAPRNIFTPMRAPGRVVSQVSLLGNQSVVVTWSAPDPPNGPISWYEVRLRDDGEGAVNETVAGGERSLLLQPLCGGDAPRNLTVTVAAVNKDGARQHTGPPSNASHAEICTNQALDTRAIIGISVAVGLAFLCILVFALYRLWKWCNINGKMDVKFPDPEQSEAYYVNQTLLNSSTKEPYIDIMDPPYLTIGDDPKLDLDTTIEEPDTDQDSGHVSGGSPPESLTDGTHSQAGSEQRSRSGSENRSRSGSEHRSEPRSEPTSEQASSGVSCGLQKAISGASLEKTSSGLGSGSGLQLSLDQDDKPSLVMMAAPDRSSGSSGQPDSDIDRYPRVHVVSTSEDSGPGDSGPGEGFSLPSLPDPPELRMAGWPSGDPHSTLPGLPGLAPIELQFIIPSSGQMFLAEPYDSSSGYSGQASGSSSSGRADSSGRGASSGHPSTSGSSYGPSSSSGQQSSSGDDYKLGHCTKGKVQLFDPPDEPAQPIKRQDADSVV